VAPGSAIYARSIVEGNLIFLSAMDGRDVETGTVSSSIFEEQMVTALDKIREAMEEAGSSMNNIIKTHMLLIPRENYSSLRKVESEYYRKHTPLLLEQSPASMCIVPASLAMPEFLIEIEAYAVISR
jgi:2-iminobutanoate/2-iminopropanoate deaminase